MSKGWAVITGSSKRLGRNLSLECARLGWDVVVHARNSIIEAESVVEECKKFGRQAVLIQADMGVESDIEQFCKKCLSLDGDISLLVNNIGIYNWGSCLEADMKEASLMFQLNTLLPLRLTQAFASSLKATQGSVINIGSAGVGFVYADTFAPLYHTSKAAELMLTRSLAKELLSDGVRVNMISPGTLENSVTLTDGGESLPMGRAGTLKEVVGLFRYLLSTDASYITGQNIEVAGGFRLL